MDGGPVGAIRSPPTRSRTHRRADREGSSIPAQRQANGSKAEALGGADCGGVRSRRGIRPFFRPPRPGTDARLHRLPSPPRCASISVFVPDELKEYIDKRVAQGDYGPVGEYLTVNVLGIATDMRSNDGRYGRRSWSAGTRGLVCHGQNFRPQPHLLGEPPLIP